MNQGNLIVHLIRPDAGCDESLLTEDDLLRAGSFRFEADRIRWVACRSGLRRILAAATGTKPADLPLVANPFGKPLLAPPFDSVHFNLSHCGNLAVLAVSRDGPVGIDIEPLDRAAELLEVIGGFCHPLEVAELPGGPAATLRLLEIWTAKEALLKALGTGFSTAPESVRTTFTENGITGSTDDPSLRLGGFVVHRIEDPRLAGHLAMVCVDGLRIPLITVTELHSSDHHSAG